MKKRDDRQKHINEKIKSKYIIEEVLMFHRFRWKELVFHGEVEGNFLSRLLSPGISVQIFEVLDNFQFTSFYFFFNVCKTFILI